MADSQHVFASLMFPSLAMRMPSDAQPGDCNIIHKWLFRLIWNFALVAPKHQSTRGWAIFCVLPGFWPRWALSRPKSGRALRRQFLALVACSGAAAPGKRKNACRSTIYARFCVTPGFWPRWALSWLESGIIAVPARLVSGLGEFVSSADILPQHIGRSCVKF